VKRTFVTALALSIATGASSAQIPDLPTLGSSWLDVGYPRLYYTPTNGLAAGLYYAQFRPLGFEDWDAPPPYRASLSIDGLIATSGTGRLGIEGKFPKLVPGWRFELRLWLKREARQNYFGIGNNSEFDGDNVTDAQPYYYRQDRKRMYARGAIQREIVGRLRTLVGFHVERFSIDTLPGPSLYGDQVAAGSVPPPHQATTDANVRLGLLYDSRDDEVDPTRGVHFEAIYSVADSTVAGNVSYSRITIAAAGHLPLGERVSTGIRVVGQSMAGAPPPGTYHLIEASGAPFEALGGPDSHRGLAADRFLAEDKLFGNLDVRYRAVGERHLFTGNLVAFLDVGRVFQPVEEDFALTLRGMHVGGGFGIIITYSRSGVLGWTIGYGPDGPAFQTQVGWIF